MKKVINRIYGFCCLSITTLLVSGCLGGGSSSTGGSSIAEFLPSGGGGGTPTLPTGGGETTVPFVHNPEPSSILLLSSGLIGIAIYMNAKLKSQSKIK
jgi:hypothetical protein